MAQRLADRQPVISQITDPFEASEDERLLGWWQGATGYNTADETAHSMVASGTGSAFFSGESFIVT